MSESATLKNCPSWSFVQDRRSVTNFGLHEFIYTYLNGLETKVYTTTTLWWNLSFPQLFILVVVCSTASTQYWIYNIGAVPKPDKFWKPWKFNGKTAGFLTEFDLGVTNSSFIFVTVHGAGHEMPAYRPAEAFAMFESFFSGNRQLFFSQQCRMKQLSLVEEMMPKRYR